MAFHVRTEYPDATLARALRRELRAFDSRIQVPTAMAYDELRQQALYPNRALALISSGFGALALALAVAGIYGVMAHLVAARRREFAVRLALGAPPGRLAATVLRQGLRWSLAGVAVGTAMALVMSRLLQSFLYGVSTFDPWSIGGTVIALLLVSAAAAYAPARRVLRIDPAATLRS
jgi:ABC-type antimicrobial peptide transport system permease subunit